MLTIIKQVMSMLFELNTPHIRIEAQKTFFHKLQFKSTEGLSN